MDNFGVVPGNQDEAGDSFGKSCNEEHGKYKGPYRDRGWEDVRSASVKGGKVTRRHNGEGCEPG